MSNYEFNKIDIDECSSRGACSITPTIAGLEEVAMLFLQHIAHYILKLEEFGANNINIRYETISALASLVSINEFSENQLHSIILEEYYILKEVKNTYSKICKDRDIKQNNTKNFPPFDEKTTVAQSIALGEKLILLKSNKNSQEEKNLTTILQTVLKSISINLMKLKDFEKFDKNAYKELLETLDIFNHKKPQKQELILRINKLAELDNKIQEIISQELIKAFGNINETEVTHSTRKGKNILVSGDNLLDLYKILEQTKDSEIDIYTHSNLLIAHAFKKFKQFKNLVGHYGTSTENCILDFATFSGAILLTKNSKNVITEYLYRGRLYSNAYIVPNGVIKIENNDFKPLIETAKEAKGFTKNKEKASSKLGYNEEFIKTRLHQIIENLNSNNIKKLYIIGLNNHSESQKAYFSDLFDNLDNDEYVISFSYESKKENVLTINIGNYTPLATSLLKQFFKNFSLTDSRVVFYLTTCDVMTISGIITLANKKAKNIYMANCPPTKINPSTFQTFCKQYSINTTTTAQKDLETIRKS